MQTITLPGVGLVPVIGQGTWKMGADHRLFGDEVAALKRGIELGMTLIDTAEMYANGRAEEVVAEAIAGQRERITLVSKVLPHNASLAGTIKACENSLRRLRVETLDLYLLHWRGDEPLAATLEAFQRLEKAGKIRSYGVSNFATADMQEWSALGGTQTATNQVLYNLKRRGPEWDLLPWLRARNIPLMAYSPIEQGELLDDPRLRQLALEHGRSPAQMALAWVCQQPGVVAIPKASSIAHLEDNRQAGEITLSDAELRALDAIFPPPKRATPLEII